MRALYLQMWWHAAGMRWRLLLASAMLVASQVVKLAVPWLAAKAIGALEHSSVRGDSRDAGTAALAWVAAIVGLYALCWTLHGPGRVLERSVAMRVRRSLAEQLYAKLSDAPLSWHSGHHPAELAHRVAQATQALSTFSQSQFICLQSGVNLIGPLVALMLISKPAGVVALVGLVAIAATIVAFDRVLMQLARLENAAERRYGAMLADCLVNMLSIASLRLQPAAERLLARRFDSVVAPLSRHISLNEWKWCAVDLLGIVLVWSEVAIYAWQTHVDGALMLGGIFMVYQYAQQSGSVIGSLAGNFQSFARMRSDFASAEPVWAAPGGAAVRTTTGEAVPPWHRIDLCDLAYSHPPDAEGVRRTGVRNASLRLHPGERIALVGPSGSGKSTLLRLIAGLAEPSHGHLKIDGVASPARFGLRQWATLVPQEAQLFEATLRENLVFDFDVDETAIAAAARVASLDSVIAGLPQGLSTPVLQGGSNLSGGQRQRLCLARGLIAARGSRVLLLDEPTSALDPIAEASVFARLGAAFPSSCIVASVHRLDLLAHFDRVALLVDGEIVDVGTRDELRARQPLFRRMLGESERASSDALEADRDEPLLLV